MKSETFTSYTSLDFAQEPSFIRWVRAGDEDAAVFWQNWLEQHPEKATEIAEARLLASALKVREEEPSALQLQNLWNRIDAATQDSAPETEDKIIPIQGGTRVRPIRRWLSYAAAACVTLLLVALAYNPTRSISAGIGEQQTHELPDGSSVVINAASKVSYHPLRWGFARKIELEGEAFFEVTKGRRFVVKTAQGEVEVLGTSFNVRVRGNSFAVSCVTGKVRVSNPKGEQILTPGLSTQTNANGDLLTPYTITEYPPAAWREDKFYFKDIPLQEVFEEMQRQFDVRIQTTPEIARKKVTLYFEANNLDSVLFNIRYTSGVEIESRGNLIIVK